MQNLAGKRILITRAAEQASALLDALDALGAMPIQLPLITIREPESWDEFDYEFLHIYEYSWLFFASTNAVDACINRASSLGIDLKDRKNHPNLKIACIGKSTEKHLSHYGLKASFTPSEFVAESFIKEFPDKPNEASNRILWPRTNVGRDVINLALEQAGWLVHTVECYNTGGPADPEEAANQLKSFIDNKALDAITLASSETARQLAKLFRLQPFANSTRATSSAGPPTSPSYADNGVLDGIKLVAIGPATAKTCMELFGRVDGSADRFDVEGLVRKLIEVFY